MASDPQHCSFVLLAEFDILRGAQLTYQFPQPLGTDEWLMANLMLPDGAEKHLEDWTIFFLNQTPFNTIAPVLALETPEEGHGEDEEEDGSELKPELLYVLNLVRTKQDKSLPRGALVKAMAICTRHPFIQIFKPVLLMALDDYFLNPSKECLCRLFDAVNSMDISGAPILTRHEKLIMRCSERKDVFAEKFRPPEPIQSAATVSTQPPPKLRHSRNGSVDSKLSFEEGLLGRSRESKDKDDSTSFIIDGGAPPSTSSHGSGGQPQPQIGTPSQGSTLGHSPPSDSSFSLGGSAVWVGDDGGGDHTMNGKDKEAMRIPPSISRNRKSVDASSTSSSNTHGNGSIPHLTLVDPLQGIKDTHFFPTSIAYKGHQLPIKMPLSTFPEEVGEYSLIQLIQTFSTPTATVTGPHHPHLHTNGSLTHPVILLFNALITGKRIVFLGHNRPAGQVSSYVLSACALGSGCGSVLRGFVERAFPYAHLTNREEWESIPGYIAGVTNLIFESSKSWDLLCDVSTGRMVISKDITTTHPYSPPPSFAPQLISRTGTLKAESSVGSEEEFGKLRTDFSSSKSENYDNMFMEDIISAISYHFGESLVRARFTDYVWRFVRLAARYDEELNGSTRLGWPTTSFADRGDRPRLGSGLTFFDDSAGVRELQANACRIEGWKQTRMCKYWAPDFQKSLATDAIQGVDIYHQLSRLRHGKNLPDAEVELMMRTFAENLQNYDQVVEMLALMPPHQGGLLPLSLGLLHPQEIIRDCTVDIFNELRQYPVGVILLQSLNHFQRYAYVRQAAARKAKLLKEQSQPHASVQQPQTAPIFSVRTPSNRSESSLGGIPETDGQYIR